MYDIRPNAMAIASTKMTSNTSITTTLILIHQPVRPLRALRGQILHQDLDGRLLQDEVDNLVHQPLFDHRERRFQHEEWNRPVMREGLHPLDGG
jgi:hypothetical protein